MEKKGIELILITGAAGFIGSRTAEILLERGEEIIGLDNLNDYYDVNLKLHRLNNLSNYANFKFYETDIESMPDLRRIFDEYNFSSVINLAARAGVRASIENPFVYASTNIVGTLNLLELCQEHSIGKFVLASSSSLYAGEATPFKESMTVDHPISQYAASKKAAELMAYSYHHLYNVDISILRFFTVFGPAGRPDMSYFKFIKQIDQGDTVVIYGDGTQTRDFTYIDDIAEGVIKSIQPLGYEIINLGGGKSPISINRMIELIESGLEKKANIEYREFHSADMLETGADISKAKALLDWAPQIDFEQGILHTIDWYNRNKSLISSLK